MLRLYSLLSNSQMLHVSHPTLLLYSNYHNLNVQYFIWVGHLPLCISVWIGDGDEWDRQCFWHSELLSSLDKVDVSMEQLQQDQEKWITQGGHWATTLQAMVRKMALWSIFLATHTIRSDVLLKPPMPNVYNSQSTRKRWKD